MKRAIINTKIASFSTFSHTPLKGESMNLKEMHAIAANPTALLRAAKIPGHSANRHAAKQMLVSLVTGASAYLQIGSNVYKLNSDKTEFKFFVHFE